MLSGSGRDMFRTLVRRHTSGQEADASREGCSAAAVAPLLVPVVCLALVLYASLAAGWPRFSRAEVFFAECAREMLGQSDWITPLYHGKPFFDKPILMYWWIIGTFTTFGISHLSARIPAIIAALITVALTGTGTARLFGRRGGALAAMALASSFMFISFAASCMSDMNLVLYDTLAMALLYAGLEMEQRRGLIWWLASAAMGLAFLTKGPVGVVLPAVAFAAFLAVTRKLSTVKPRHLAVGALTVLAIGLPWFLAAYRANGLWAISWFFLRENLQRFAGSTYDTHKPAWFMVASFVSGFAPWSLFLPFIVFVEAQEGRRLGRKGKGGKAGPGSAPVPPAGADDGGCRRKRLFLWLYLVAVLGFFSVSRGKCDYYALPAYPAAAALVGAHLSRWIAGGCRPAYLVGWLFAAGFAAVGALAVYPLGCIAGGKPFFLWAALPVTLVLSGLAIAGSLWRGRLYLAYAAAFAGICLAGTGFAWQGLKEIGEMQFTGRFCRQINHSPPGTRIGVLASHANSIDEITFQTGREPVRLNTAAELARFLSLPGIAVAVVSEDELSRLPESGRPRIVDRMLAISRPVTPGYVIESKGRLVNPVPLCLVINK